MQAFEKHNIYFRFLFVVLWKYVIGTGQIPRVFPSRSVHGIVTGKEICSSEMEDSIPAEGWVSPRTATRFLLEFCRSLTYRTTELIKKPFALHRRA
jgi:hypothetical protein